VRPSSDAPACGTSNHSLLAADLHARPVAASPATLPRHRGTRSVAASALPGGSGSDAGAADADSPTAALLALAAQQRGVTGKVLRWSDAAGLETLPASEYISDLEGEVRRLRDTLASLQRAGEGRNALLEELKAMEPSNLAELTTRAVRAPARQVPHVCEKPGMF
jgi:hypothetical protein